MRIDYRNVISREPEPVNEALSILISNRLGSLCNAKVIEMKPVGDSEFLMRVSYHCPWREDTMLGGELLFRVKIQDVTAEEVMDK